MKEKLNVMVDCETLSTDISRGLVLSVAIVPFTLNRMEDVPKDAPSQMFYFNIDDSIAHGRVIDNQTLNWWYTGERKQQYYAMLQSIDKFGKGFVDGWKAVYYHLAALAEKYTLIMWSRGTDFDFPLIESSIRMAGITKPMPYRYYNKCDQRTVCKLAEQLAKLDMSNNLPMHDAYDDCLKQIKDLQLALMNLGYCE